MYRVSVRSIANLVVPHQIRCVNNSSKIDYSLVPILDEEHLEEKLTHGHGPGGQNVNKALNCVFLKHLPTGLYVKVHQSREAHKNRLIARQLLTLKLDEHCNGELSVAAQKRRLLNEKAKRKDRQAEKRRELRAQFKANLGREDDSV